MELKITNKAKGKPVANGDAIPINVTKDKCCVTLNTRYEAISVGHIMNLAHFPRTVILLKWN